MVEKETNQVEEKKKRKILFRGRTIDGVWIEGYLHQALDVENKVVHTMIMRNMTNIDVFNGKPFQASYIVDENSVGQFTGLYDKNGKPIFEGDIIREIDFWDKPEDYTRQVEWKDTSCGFEPFSDSEENCGHCGGGVIPGDCVVVGNIHDNPELLEVK